MDYSREIAKALLEVKAVFLRPNEPFLWASGIKSPIYCDNRLTLAHPQTRTLIENAIADTVKTVFGETEVVMGTATAGIPHAAIVSDILALPMGYVRGDNKTHGRCNQIEGAPVRGKKVVVVEDLISTGGSSIEVVEALRSEGADVLGIVSIFTYGMAKGIAKLKEANVKLASLSNFNTLVEVAEETKYISAKEKRMLLAFQAHPQDSSWQDVK